MRRKIAIGTLGFMVVLAIAIVTWAQEGPPQGPEPGQGQHEFGGGGQHPWGNGPHEFRGGGRGPFGGPGEGGMGWQNGGRRGFCGGEHLLRMIENPRVRQYLGLSDEQVSRLHGIGVAAEKASVQTCADLELGHIELRELMRADNPDHDAIIQKIDQLTTLRGKMQKQRVETLFSARSVLTPEQQKKIKTFMENRGFGGGMERGHMERHGGPGRHPGQPGGPGGPAPRPAAPPAQ